MNENFRRPGALCLTGNLHENWKKFIQHYEIFSVATKGNTESPEVQVAQLLNLAGEEAIELFSTFNISTVDKKDVDKVKKKFEEFCNPRKNIVYERYLFYTRSQREGEPFDHFLTDISKLVKSCEFLTAADDMLRDRIVLGVADQEIQAKLLKMDDLTLKKSTEVCRVAEITGAQAKEVQQGRSPIDNINQQNKYANSGSAIAAVSSNFDKVKNSSGSYSHEHNSDKYQKFNKFNFRSSNNQRENTAYPVQPSYKQSNAHTMQQFNCKNCSYNHVYGKCPAYGIICSRCRKPNHYAKVCKSVPSNTKQRVYDIAENDDECFMRMESLTLDEIVVDSLGGAQNSKCWYQNLNIENTTIKFKLDTGADVNIIPIEIYRKIVSSIPVHATEIKLEAFGGFRLSCVGEVTLDIDHKGAHYPTKFILISDIKSKPILGLNSCLQLGLIQRLDSINRDETDAFIQTNIDIFQGIGKFPDKCSLQLKENSVPVSKPPRRIPLSIRNKVLDKLNDMEKFNIISKVDEPSDWTHNLVIVEKPDKTLRICLDPRELNKNLKQDHYLIPTLEDFIVHVQHMKYFSVLDLRDGFWQLELDENSKRLTTFSTPFGCYLFNVLPFGLKTAPEEFQKLNSKYFGNLPGCFVYIDDILVGGKTIQEHDTNLANVVSRAREINVKFNPKKFQYRTDKVRYLGHVFSQAGMESDPDRVQAIQNIRNPTNRKELERILGTLNYLRNFIPNYAEMNAPIRSLLRKDINFSWTSVHSKLLEAIKAKISKSTTLQIFREDLPIVIQTDASKNGLGCCLIQDERPVCFASKSLSDAECNYAQIEKEMLAIVYACKKFHHFIYGRQVTIHTDHKPLVSIMKKLVSDIHSNRLQRMRIKLLIYTLNVVYVPGRYLHVADLLSRNSGVDDSIDTDLSLKDVVHSIEIPESKIEIFKNATQNDEVLQTIKEYFLNGWPTEKKRLPDAVKFYWGLKDKLYYEDGLVFYENRIFIPQSLRKKILDLLHESHFGITKTKARAKHIFYWPNMNTDIENVIFKCRICEKYKPSNPYHSLRPHPIPQNRFEKVGCDLFEHAGNSYLVLMDYFSKWLEIEPIPSKTAGSVITSLKKIFSIHGIPKVVVADNQPFNSFELHKFSDEWEFQFIHSSPHYPHSNGLAEKAVHIAKTILKKTREENKDFYYSLLEYRSTPVANLGYSPSQILQSRLLRSKLPIQSQLLQPQIVYIDEQLKANQAKQIYYHDRLSRRKEIYLTPGDNITYQNQNKWDPAVIVRQHSAPRSYIIRNELNNELRRNTTHLRQSMNAPNFRMNNELDTNNKNETVVETRDEEHSTNQPITLSSTGNPNQASHYITKSGRVSKPPAYYGN